MRESRDERKRAYVKVGQQTAFVLKFERFLHMTWTTGRQAPHNRATRTSRPIHMFFTSALSDEMPHLRPGAAQRSAATRGIPPPERPPLGTGAGSRGPLALPRSPPAVEVGPKFLRNTSMMRVTIGPISHLRLPLLTVASAV